MPFRSVFYAGLLALAVVVAGCGGTGRLRYTSAEEAFQKGKEFYDSGKYHRAVEYFQGVFDYGRVSEIAADAQLYLARAYYQDGQYILASSEFTRFIELYRNDPRGEQAEFERAMAYYQLSPAYQLDQTETQRAVDYFNLFLDRFPQSELADDAEARILELREKMAHKLYARGGLYEQRELFEAAALSYELAFDQYPDTHWADDALLGALRAYLAFADQSIRERQEERLQKAIDNYQRLVQLFPESPHHEAARALHEQALSRQRSLAGNS